MLSEAEAALLEAANHVARESYRKAGPGGSCHKQDKADALAWLEKYKPILQELRRRRDSYYPPEPEPNQLQMFPDNTG